MGSVNNFGQAGLVEVNTNLGDLAIKTSDLALTRAFWCGVIGLREVARPDFGYPGAWLACPQPGGQAIVHVYAGGPALAGLDHVPSGSAAIDHLSLACVGYHAYRARFAAADLSWREFLVPGTTLLVTSLPAVRPVADEQNLQPVLESDAGGSTL